MVVGNGNLYFCCCSIILDTKGKKFCFEIADLEIIIQLFINNGGRVNPIQITSKTSLKSWPYYKLNSQRYWKWNEAKHEKMKKKKKNNTIIYCLSKNLVRDDTNSDYKYFWLFFIFYFFLDSWLLRHCSWNLTCFEVNIYFIHRFMHIYY